MNLEQNRNGARVAFFGSFFGNAKNERLSGSDNKHNKHEQLIPPLLCHYPTSYNNPSPHFYLAQA